MIENKYLFNKLSNDFAPAVLVNDVLHGHPVRPGGRRVLRARLAASAAAHPRRDGVAPVDGGVVGGDGVVAEQVRGPLSRRVELGLSQCGIH